jgi:hypothetical protein
VEYFSFSCGVVVGMVSYRLISGFFDLGHIGLYIKEAEKSALIMLATAAEAVAYIQMIKYNTLKDLKIPESTIKTTMNVDDYNFNAWKNSAVSNLLAAYPEKYKSIARYVDWETAMEFLDKVYKKKNKRSK